MRAIEEIKTDKHIKRIDGFVVGMVTGEIKLPLCRGSFVFGIDEPWGDGKRVEHLSFAPYNEKHTPSWDELCMLKDIFWGEEEECFQLFPKRSEYVNIKENCLHIWRFK